MFASALIAAVAVLAVPLQQGGAQQVDGLTTVEGSGITLKYLGPSESEAKNLLGTLQEARRVLSIGAGLELSVDPIVRVCDRPGARRVFWTDGEDHVSLDLPTLLYRNLQPRDSRVMDFAIPAFTQLWLMHSLTSTAGLDPRILDSIVEYLSYLWEKDVAKANKPGAGATTVRPVPPPTGPGAVWYQIEEAYPGTTSFVLVTLASSKLPGHLVGSFLRKTAQEVTDDPSVGALFDSIAPPEPIFKPEDVEPSAQISPTTMQRRGRLLLFNGTPLFDVVGEPIAVADRLQDFENIYEMMVSIVPDAGLATPPPQRPTVNGVDVWKLHFEFRARVQRARDNLDYYLVLREFLSRFGDRWFSLRPNSSMKFPPGQPQFLSVTGMNVVASKGRLYVATVTPDSAPAKAGIQPGMEVASVDGRPAERVWELLTDFARTFDSSPSLQCARAFAANAVLTGLEGSEATFELRSPGNSEPKTYRLARGLPSTVVTMPPALEVLAPRPDRVGVIRVRDLRTPSTQPDALTQFAAALRDFSQKEQATGSDGPGVVGLVIDLRGNDGMRGRKEFATAAASALLSPGELPTAVATELHRDRNKPLQVEREQVVIAPLPNAHPFRGPIAVLTDGLTSGEAEFFVLALKMLKRAKQVGTTTAGSVSQPKDFEHWQSLSRSRIDLNFARSRVVRPDDSPIQGVGLLPDVEVEPDPADLAAGRDTVLERACALLAGH